MKSLQNGFMTERDKSLTKDLHMINDFGLQRFMRGFAAELDRTVKTKLANDRLASQWLTARVQVKHQA